jgi:hypothetical protein
VATRNVALDVMIWIALHIPSIVIWRAQKKSRRALQLGQVALHRGAYQPDAGLMFSAYT